MVFEIPLFIDYLKEQKNASESTVDSYQRDLRKLEKYLSSHGIDHLENVTASTLKSYLMYLEKQGLSTATVSRNVASMKAFFHYVIEKHEISDDPTESIKAPHIEKKEPGVLNPEESARLLEQPSGDSPKALRDRAMLRLMYETGMRVTELISIRISDIHQDSHYVICRDKDKKKEVPFGEYSGEALEAYLKDGREKLLNGNDSDFVFVNCSGKPMSRQGFWKLVKRYSSKAGINADITPQTLRHSFASDLLQVQTGKTADYML